MGNEEVIPSGTPEATLPFGAQFTDRQSANSDARASGAQQANREFVEDAGFDSETLGSFVSSSEGLTAAQQSEIADKKNWVGRTLGAGTKWGTLGAPWEGAPAWLRVPNPLKTLGAWSEHIIQPAWAGVVGFASEGLASIPANTRESIAGFTGSGPNINRQSSIIDKAAAFTDLTGTALKMVGGATSQTMRNAESVEQVWRGTQFDGTLAERWQQLEDFDEVRPELFAGERLFGSLVADPLSYMGFGLYSKIPLVGKINLAIKGRNINVGLGGLEQGFINPVDFPFKLGARAYKKFIPKARSQTATQVAVRAQAAADVTAERAVGKAVTDIVDPDDIAKVFAETTNLNVVDELVAPSTRELRDHMYTRPNPQGVELGTMSRLSGLKQAYRDMTYGVGEDIGGVMNLVIRGRMNIEAASDQIIGLLNGVVSPKSSDNMIAYLQQQVKVSHAEVQRMITKGDMMEIRARISARSHNVAEANLNRIPVNLPRKITIAGTDIKIADALAMQGRIAGILQRVDYTAYKYQQAWYGQKGAKTFAGWVLMFPGFTPGNILEETGRTLGMGLKAGSADSVRMARRLQGLNHNFHQLIDPTVQGASIINRVQASRLIPEEAFDALRAAGASESWMSRNKGKLKWLNPKTFRDSSVAPAMKIRQHGVIELQHRAFTTDIVEHEPWIAEILKEIPEGVSPKLRETMIEEMIAVSAQGPDVIRNAVNTIASNKLNENKILNSIQKILGDGTYSADVVDSFQRWASNPSRRLNE